MIILVEKMAHLQLVVSCLFVFPFDAYYIYPPAGELSSQSFLSLLVTANILAVKVRKQVDNIAWFQCSQPSGPSVFSVERGGIRLIVHLFEMLGRTTPRTVRTGRTVGTIVLAHGPPAPAQVDYCIIGHHSCHTGSSPILSSLGLLEVSRQGPAGPRTVGNTTWF